MMALSEVSRSRLLALADFIELLPAHRFRFLEVRETDPYGVRGCIVGWMPEALPDVCSAGQFGTLFAGKRAFSKTQYLDFAAVIIGIPPEEAKMLFTPYCGPALALPALGDDTTPCQAAEFLRAYVRLRSRPSWRPLDFPQEERAA